MAKRKRRDFSHVGFTLPTASKRELEQRADDQEITTSQLLRHLVRSYLKNGAARAVSTTQPSGGTVGTTQTRL